MSKGKVKENRRRLSSVNLDVDTLSIGQSYPWNLLWRTILLWVSFLTSAGAESVRPPTLLDIRNTEYIMIMIANDNVTRSYARDIVKIFSFNIKEHQRFKNNLFNYEALKIDD